MANPKNGTDGEKMFNEFEDFDETEDEDSDEDEDCDEE